MKGKIAHIVVKKRGCKIQTGIYMLCRFVTGSDCPVTNLHSNKKFSLDFTASFKYLLFYLSLLLLNRYYRLNEVCRLISHHEECLLQILPAFENMGYERMYIKLSGGN